MVISMLAIGGLLIIAFLLVEGKLARLPVMPRKPLILQCVEPAKLISYHSETIRK